MPEFEPLHPQFGVAVTGVDLSGPLDDVTFAAIKSALDRHSLLVFRDQPLEDDAQIAFSARFGPLHKTRAGAIGEGSDLVVLSNLDSEGNVRAASDHQVFHARANQLWHSDASFRPVPAYASVLSGRRVASRGGETEFVSTRAAYASLDETTKARIDRLEAIHHFAHSRSLIEPGRITQVENDDLPPVRHPLVRRHSVTGEPALFIGSHVREVVGLPLEEGLRLIEALLQHATDDACIHAHRWQAGDVIVWDNSAVLHRGRPWDLGEPRHMKRATVVDAAYCDGALIAA